MSGTPPDDDDETARAMLRERGIKEEKIEGVLNRMRAEVKSRNRLDEADWVETFLAQFGEHQLKPNAKPAKKRPKDVDLRDVSASDLLDYAHGVIPKVWTLKRKK